MENTNEKPEEITTTGGLKSIGIGLLIFGVAYYFYYTMTQYENGEGIRMNRLLLIAYGALGKNITVAILGLFGALLSYGGFREFMSARKKG